jgi:catechol 2,3-dioxygenase-like lactoylglutathione lyase family enzyme
MVSDEPYLMPSYVKLLVSDADRSAAFYESMGFTRIHQDPVFVHLRWMRYADLFLVATPKGLELPGKRGVGVILCFHAGDVSLETLAARAEALGAATDGPRDQPWHTRELLVTDPEGYRLSFVEPAP